MVDDELKRLAGVAPSMGEHERPRSFSRPAIQLELEIANLERCQRRLTAQAIGHAGVESKETERRLADGCTSKLTAAAARNHHSGKRGILARLADASGSFVPVDSVVSTAVIGPTS